MYNLHTQGLGVRNQKFWAKNVGNYIPNESLGARVEDSQNKGTKYAKEKEECTGRDGALDGRNPDCSTQACSSGPN